MSNTLQLSTTPNSFDVEIDGKNYLLKEATAADAKTYRSSAMKSFRFGEEGNPESIVGEGLAEAEVLLVSMCLYEKVVNEASGETNLSKVGKAKISSWPSRVVKALFDKAKEISDMDEDSDIDGLIKQRDKLDKQIKKLQEKEETRKNSQGTTTDGSD